MRTVRRSRPGARTAPSERPVPGMRTARRAASVEAASSVATTTAATAAATSVGRARRPVASMGVAALLVVVRLVPAPGASGAVGRASPGRVQVASVRQGHVLAASGAGDRARPVPDPAVSALAGLARSGHVQPAARAMTAARRFVTATRAIAGHPRAVTAMPKAHRIADPPRSARASTTATSEPGRRAAQRRLATSCTVGTPCWKPSEPGGPFGESW
jgi:hypothetical protein